MGQSISGRYTHYCACAVCNGNSRGITTSGRRIYNGMSNPHYVACNWLPLGSVISVNKHQLHRSGPWRQRAVQPGQN